MYTSLVFFQQVGPSLRGAVSRQPRRGNEDRGHRSRRRRRPARRGTGSLGAGCLVPRTRPAPGRHARARASHHRRPGRPLAPPGAGDGPAGRDRRGRRGAARRQVMGRRVRGAVARAADRRGHGCGDAAERRRRTRGGRRGHRRRTRGGRHLLRERRDRGARRDPPGQRPAADRGRHAHRRAERRAGALCGGLRLRRTSNAHSPAPRSMPCGRSTFNSSRPAP